MASSVDPAFMSWLARRQNPDAPPELAPDAPGDTPTAPQLPLAKPQADANPFMSQLRAAQDSDKQDRDALVRQIYLARGLGRGMTPQQIDLARPRSADNLVQGVKARGELAQDQIQEADLPYAATNAKAKADLTQAHAAQFQQQATKGAADLAESERTRTEDWDAGSPASSLARGYLKSIGIQVPETTSYGQVKPMLSDIVKTRLAEMAARARVQASGLGGGGIELTPQALDAEAERTARTGQLSQLGMGRAGGALKAKILNRAAELHPDLDLAGAKASYSADTHSLGKLQTQADNLEAFENTGRKNIQTLLDASSKIVNLGSPLLNKPARWISRNVAGDPSMSAFEAARQTAATEAGKILGGALGGTLSDSARHEAEVMMDPNATPEQLAAAAQTLLRDFDNRKAATHQQLSEIRTRSSGRQQPAAAPAEKVRVRRKSDGAIGNIPAANFDPQKYEKVQ